MIIHLGVSDIPYSNDKDGKTTGDVAEILEAKYGVMGAFADAHSDDIVHAMKSSIEGAFESMLASAPRNDVYGSGTSEIEDRFQRFLDDKEIEGLGIAGVPTKAALAGVNHRLKHPYKKRAARQSFIDTGTYQLSMRAWIDDQ